MRFWKLYMDEAMTDTMRAHVQTYSTRLGEAGEAPIAL
jgi:hypothetical protein